MPCIFRRFWNDLRIETGRSSHPAFSKVTIKRRGDGRRRRALPLEQSQIRTWLKGGSGKGGLWPRSELASSTVALIASSIRVSGDFGSSLSVVDARLLSSA